MTLLAQAPSERLFPDEIVSTTETWLHELAVTWHEEIPIRIHSDEIDAMGSREFDPAFLRYIERDCRRPGCYDLNCTHGQERPEPQRRARKAFRKLKRIAPREFDALYLIVARRFTIADVAHALTKRAIELDKPERYDEAAVLVLVVSGIDKISRWF